MISMYRMKTLAQDPSTKNPPAKTRATRLAAPGDPAKGSKGASPPPSPARRIQVRKSGVHGKGVFAVQPLVRGETIIEYKGEVISWPEADRRHPHDPEDPNHTFYFSLDDGNVIDASFGGNAARWINHSCQPNCKAVEKDGRVFIKSLRALKVGDELNYDYGLVIEGRLTKQLKKDYECRCGSKKCRGTMLSLRD
jgi:uncharacterized protein